jgi:hypothetical protein
MIVTTETSGGGSIFLEHVLRVASASRVRAIQQIVPRVTKAIMLTHPEWSFALVAATVAREVELQLPRRTNFATGV